MSCVLNFNFRIWFEKDKMKPSVEYEILANGASELTTDGETNGGRMKDNINSETGRKCVGASETVS